MRRALALPVLFALAAPAAARNLEIRLPIDCTLGQSCFVQNYVDADPGPGAADFTCGPLTYDGHKGTDFALPSFAAMRAGVNVLAAAPGVVTATRDDMPDRGADGTPPAELKDHECGNGVLIDHGGGWETQYCHMKQGSIAVTRGARVTMGARLGQVGYSGQTQFPHLHLSLRHDGKVVDPFNADGIATCTGGDVAGDELWLNPIAYRPGGLIAVGASDAVPDFAAVKAGDAAHATLPANAAALVGWAYVFGGRKGDKVEIRLTAPDGSVLIDHTDTLGKAQAQLFRAAGKKASGSWTLGEWIISARLIRGETALGTRQTTVTITP